jgi:biopolymer transport protein ExbD
VAFSPNGGGSRGRGRFQYGGALSEINVTPFVDVLLVLLVIFMLTAHVMETGFEVDVPAVKYTKENAKDLPIVNISRESEVYLGDKIININDLAPQVQSRYGKASMVYVRCDKHVPYEILAQVLAELGATKIGVSLVTKPEDTTTRRKR